MEHPLFWSMINEDYFMRSMVLFKKLPEQRQKRLESECADHKEEETCPSSSEDLSLPDLAKQISSFYDSPAFSDVTLSVGPHLFHAHRLILCAWSDVLRQTLAGAPPIVRLDEPDETAAVFADFLGFLYRESVALTPGSVYPVFRLAEKYGVGDLADLCQEFLMEGLAGSRSIGTGKYFSREESQRLVQLLGRAERHGMTRVHDHCLRFLQAYFQFLDVHTLVTLEPRLCAKLLASDQVVVHSELELALTAIKWLTHPEAPVSNRDHTVAIFDCIRFGNIDPAGLKLLSAYINRPTMYPQLSSLLKARLPPAFEWAALKPQDYFKELPYHVRYVSYLKNIAPQRYYMFDNTVKQLEVGLDDGKIYTHADKIPVTVVMVTLNGEHRGIELDCQMTGTTFRDRRSSNWGLIYHVMVTDAVFRECSDLKYNLVLITATAPGEETRRLVSTMDGLMPGQEDSHCIRVRISPELTRLPARPHTVMVLATLVIHAEKRALCSRLSLHTPAELVAQNAKKQKCPRKRKREDTVC